MCVGEKIKEYIQGENLTQLYLSQMTGISTPKLNLSLNGKRRMTFEEYELICGALDLTTDRFLTPRVLEQQGSAK